MELRSWGGSAALLVDNREDTTPRMADMNVPLSGALIKSKKKKSPYKLLKKSKSREKKSESVHIFSDKRDPAKISGWLKGEAAE